MGFRFQRRLPILGNLVRLNLSASKRGPAVGVSVGIPGLRASINTRGDLVGSAGAPGTGLRYVRSRKVRFGRPRPPEDDDGPVSWQPAPRRRKIGGHWALAILAGLVVVWFVAAFAG